MTLLDMAHCMLFLKNTKLFWGDTIQCVVYLRNRYRTHAIDNKTSDDMWYGCFPSVKHLRVFGSTCYALIPKEQRSKLGGRSRK